MTADVGERIGLVAGEPVLEIGVPVIIWLVQLRLAHNELAELAFAVKSFGLQRTPIKPFVVLDADEQAFLQREAFDLEVLPVFEHERFDAEHVLVVPQRFQNNRIMKPVRYRDDHDLPGFQLGQRVLEQIREHFVRWRRQRR